MKPMEQCGACGARQMQAFSGEAFPMSHGGRSVTVPDLSGHRCGLCGEVYFESESQRRYVDASNALVHAARADEGAMLRKVRKRLGLTQQQAARLTGGGVNAFSRYELGKAQPMPAVVNLFRLLDKHPELLEELR